MGWLQASTVVATLRYVMRNQRKPKADLKVVMLRIRVTVEQKQIFEAAARNAGLDLSGWMRSLSLREVRRQEGHG